MNKLFEYHTHSNLKVLEQNPSAAMISLILAQSHFSGFQQLNSQIVNGKKNIAKA